MTTTPTQPLDIGKLKELLAKVGWTRLHTDYLDQDYDPQREGWRIHDFPPPHGDPSRPEVAHFIIDGIEDEDEARLLVEAVNALPSLILMAERVERLEVVTEQAREAIDQALDDMQDGLCVCPATKGDLTAARNALSPTTTEDQHG